MSQNYENKHLVSGELTDFFQGREVVLFIEFILQYFMFYCEKQIVPNATMHAYNLLLWSYDDVDTEISLIKGATKCHYWQRFGTPSA